MIYFKPNGTYDPFWAFTVAGEDRDYMEYCSQGFSFTYKPYVVTSGGDFLMQVQITNMSWWICRTNWEEVQPISLSALIIG